jgi:hypothetical protein
MVWAISWACLAQTDQVTLAVRKMSFIGNTVTTAECSENGKELKKISNNNFLKKFARGQGG